MPNPVTLPTGSLHLTLYEDREGFAALRQEWNGLVMRSRFPSVFLTWEWQTTWWDCLGTGALRLLAWRRPDGELVGIAPLFDTGATPRHHWQVVGCTEVADYLDIISAAGHEVDVYGGFLSYLQSEQALPWDVITLCNLHESSLSYRLLADMAREAGLEVEVAQEDVAPYLVLPSSFEAYLQSLDKKQRHELRRKRHRLEREAGSWRWFTITTTDGLDSWLERFITLHRLASADKRAFMTPAMAHFFHRLAQTMAQAGWLALAFIEIEGEPTATFFNFAFHDRIWVYNSGFDPHRHAHLSPGIVLNSYLIEDAIARGYRVFDFLQGNEAYKYRFGAVDAAVMKTTIRRRFVNIQTHT
jgi:CelD/BcsL family acetyltransferase involved in cellulose biosynthesis